MLGVEWQSPLLNHGSNQQHIGAVTIHLKIFGNLLTEHGGRKWSKRLPMLYFEIHDRLHFRISCVSQNATASERTGTKLHSALEPSNHFSLCQMLGGGINELFIIQPVIHRAQCSQSGFDIVVRMSGAEMAAIHLIGDVIGRPWLVFILIPGAEGRAHGSAGISGRRLDPDVFEWSLPEDPSVPHTIKRHAACQT